MIVDSYYTALATEFDIDAYYDSLAEPFVDESVMFISDDLFERWAAKRQPPRRLKKTGRDRRRAHREGLLIRSGQEPWFGGYFSDGPKSPRRCLRLETDLCPDPQSEFESWSDDMDEELKDLLCIGIDEGERYDEIWYQDHLDLEDSYYVDMMEREAWRLDALEEEAWRSEREAEYDDYEYGIDEENYVTRYGAARERLPEVAELDDLTARECERDYYSPDSFLKTTGEARRLDREADLNPLEPVSVLPSRRTVRDRLRALYARARARLSIVSRRSNRRSK